ncbi:MAG: ferrous iron transport protein B [Bacteroidales bacterium]|nr:ferrous iron transport protein B [Bacteroidales bacterium]
MRLSELETGEVAYITEIKGKGAFRKRITEMGFIVGKKIKVLKKAPMQDPIEYSIMGYNISIRKQEAEMIIVSKTKNNYNVVNNPEQSFLMEEPYPETYIKEPSKGKIINVALVGNPNCGKTTLFNLASKSKERVANYAGVTVDSKEAIFTYKDYTIKLVDLPGSYSLSSYSPEELYVTDYIINDKPDIVINVIDAGNIERNLYLTTQLLDMNLKVVVALNMYDELLRSRDKFDFKSLATMLGIPFIPIVSTKGKGIEKLLQAIIDKYNLPEKDRKQVKIYHSEDLEYSIEKIEKEIVKLNPRLEINPRFLAIKLLEKDKYSLKYLSANLKTSEQERLNQITANENNKLEKLYNKEVSSLIVDAKYGFISGALKETYTPSKKVNRQKQLTEKIDNFLTHKLLGIPIFFAIIWLSFYTTFYIGKYPMNWMESLVNMLSDLISSRLQPNILRDFLVDGLIGGVGGVIIFLPNIMILFFFISLMEDTGYMSRTAFLMDKAMHKAGLHGKSFIPLLMGFGCNVPAIMATRTIESKRDRLLTMFIIPFMSCSARLPVYILIISAFFPFYRANILFLMYIIGIGAALFTAIIFSKTIFRKTDTPFVIELPPYRIPTFKAIIKHSWFKSSYFLKKMGGTILLASAIIWALGYFPRDKKIISEFEYKTKSIEIQYLTKILKNKDISVKTALIKTKELELNNLEIEKQGLLLEQSFISRIGKFIQPVFAPLGFDWKMTVSIITGLAAKEIVVSSMGVLYQAAPSDSGIDQSLAAKLQKEQKVNKTPLITYFGFMIFILLYIPCFGTIIAIQKETTRLKWTLSIAAYTILIAWLFTFIVYNIGIRL